MHRFEMRTIKTQGEMVVLGYVYAQRKPDRNELGWAIMGN